MKIKLISAFLLISIGQNNILWQNKEIIFYRLHKFKNIDKKDVIKSSFKKQDVTRMGNRRWLIKISKILREKFAEIIQKIIIIFINFRRFSVFNFNIIKPNWFGCCLIT